MRAGKGALPFARARAGQAPTSTSKRGMPLCQPTTEAKKTRGNLNVLANIRSRSKGSGTHAQARRRRGPQKSTIVMVAFLLLGMAIIAYPTFSDWWNSYHQSRAIASYVQAVEKISQEEKDAMIAEAVAYNERLLQKPDRYKMSDADRAEYERTLNPTGDGVMGYIQINSIGVNLPIYHGVEEKVLQVAIGHIEGTSLPVGGPATHTAVSGHRGLPSAKLFTDLDRMVEGDTFTMTVLDQTVTYEVDQIRIVDPTDMSDLNIQQGDDFATLITCTPYGINTHRLLVRGHRIDNIAGTIVIPAEAIQIPNYIAVPAAAIPMLFAYLVGSLIYYQFFGSRPDREKVMQALEDMKVQANDASKEDKNHE